MKITFAPRLALIALVLSFTALAEDAAFKDWQHSGSLFILTTAEGANIPEGASVENFPLLVRLNKDSFDFFQAQPHGEDLRFAASDGTPLPYQIEAWEQDRGEAAIWIRVPKIQGNAHQELRVFWGKAGAKNESSGKNVFNDSNGYVSVWHMSDTVADEVGTLPSKDVNTTAINGMIGSARHFAGKQGIFCGDKIANYPSGGSSHSTEAWFRAEVPNSTIIGWGNEGGNRGSKVRMQFRSPPHVHIDSDFSDVNGDSVLPMNQWIHVAHTYAKGEGKLYINGKLDGAAKPLLNIKTPSRLWIGGWYNNYDFVGDIDEVRISNVARSADWVKLEYENQKPQQTLVGTLVKPGSEFSVSHIELTAGENQSRTIVAQAGGAHKVFWIVKRDGVETIVATDRFSYTFQAGRVVGDTTLVLQFKAIYANETKTKDIAVTIKESVPEPIVSLSAPATWNGRETIEITPVIANLAAMQSKGASDLKYTWTVSGGAVIKEIAPEKLILKRSQFSGKLTVKVAASNGGAPSIAEAQITVTEPPTDPWLQRAAEKDEQPVDNQFYARDDKNQGTLYYNGTLDTPADGIYLIVSSDDFYVNELHKVKPDKTYSFIVKLKPGLQKYHVDFGTQTGAIKTTLRTVENIVCGDAYIINGQSNALATDTRDEAPAETSEWIRSYGSPNAKGAAGNLWCNPVWKARKGEGAELGYWGMELAKWLVASEKMPVCFFNGAVGGTRIDQHQRNAANPEDVTSIYGRLLWRVRQAKLTHGIRAILWHQGENDQGADGPTGGFGWERYQEYFIEMSAGWKQDFPNLQHYYVFQIWPKACAMGVNGSDNMLREVQRNIPTLYSHMSIMSTLGIKPPGGCHYPLAGWAEFARLIQPLIERDIYGKKFNESITPPNLIQARYTDEKNDAIALEFDQPVSWNDALVSQFYLDGEKGKVATGTVSGKVLTLKLAAPSKAQKITYLDSRNWKETNLLYGANGIAALTFYEVLIAAK